MWGDQAVQSNEPPDHLTHVAHQKVSNVPQGTLSMHFIGVNPDACAKGQSNAH
jgi:hypothetical protein